MTLDFPVRLLADVFVFFLAFYKKFVGGSAPKIVKRVHQETT